MQVYYFLGLYVVVHFAQLPGLWCFLITLNVWIFFCKNYM